MTRPMTPFADDDASVTIGDLVAENGQAAVTLSGDVSLSRDQGGLKRARALKALVDAVVAALEAAGDLPERAPPDARPADEVANPFA